MTFLIFESKSESAVAHIQVGFHSYVGLFYRFHLHLLSTKSAMDVEN